MKLVILLICLVILTGCMDMGTGIGDTPKDPNMNAADATATRVMSMAAAKSTADRKAELNAQEARRAEGTQQARMDNQAALEATLTMQAWGATATADVAQSTGTAMAVAVGARATAVYEAGQATATANAWNLQSTTDASKSSALATVEAAAAGKAAQAAATSQFWATIYAALPLVLGAGSVLLLAWLIIEIGKAEVVRRRNVPRDARGDAPIYYAPKGQVYDADRNPGSIAVIKSDGTILYPPYPNEEAQERTTARDQAIDLATRGLPAPAPKKQIPGGQVISQGPLSTKLRVVGPDVLGAWLRDVLPAIYSDAIQETDDEERHE